MSVGVDVLCPLGCLCSFHLFTFLYACLLSFSESNIKSTTFAKDLRDVSARETCSAMKDALSSLATAVDRGEQSREVILSELQSHMVQSFETYEDKLKVQEMGIAARNKAVKKYVA